MSRLTFVFTLLLSSFFISTAQADNSQRLYYAAKGGYLQAAKELIDKKGANTSYSNPNGETALFAAIESKNLEMVELLLANRASVNKVNSNGSTPLHLASRVGNLEVVKLLIEKGAEVNALDKDDVTPLHEVAATGNFDVFQYLVVKGGNTEVATINGWLPLHHAARFGHTRIVSTLLHRGTPMYVQTRDKKNIFDLAKIAKHDALIDFLTKFAKRANKTEDKK